MPGMLEGYHSKNLFCDQRRQKLLVNAVRQVFKRNSQRNGGRCYAGRTCFLSAGLPWFYPHICQIFLSFSVLPLFMRRGAHCTKPNRLHRM